MEEQRLANEEIEIDLLELAGVLFRHLKALILCLVIGALAAGGITQFLLTPQYTGTSIIYILTKTTSVTSLADIQVGSALTTDFSMLATSRQTLENVIEDLELNLETEELKKMITVSNPSDTRFLQIDVEHSDPQKAADISNALATETADRVAEIMSTDRPTIVEKAIKAEYPSSPSLVKNILIGAAAGLLLAAAIILIRFLMDDTIKDEEDVVKYLRLNTLAALPIDEKEKAAAQGRNKRHKAEKKKAKVQKNSARKG